MFQMGDQWGAFVQEGLGTKSLIAQAVYAKTGESHFAAIAQDTVATVINDLVSVGVMHVPVGKPVRVRLRSKDVIHSFFLPNFRVKQDAVPGMGIEVWFTPTRPGQYEIACAELCGLGHYRMKAALTVDESDAKFNDWLKMAFEQQ